MSTTWRRGLAAAALVPLLAGLAACGDGDGDKEKEKEKEKQAGQACGPLPTADPAVTLPAGLPARDQVLYRASTQGTTRVVYGLVDEPGFKEVRDEYVAKLRAAGWTIDGTDQESVEAEAHFSKKTPTPVSGSIKVEPFCKGYVTVRYRLSS